MYADATVRAILTSTTALKPTMMTMRLRLTMMSNMTMNDDDDDDDAAAAAGGGGGVLLQSYTS